MTSPNIPPLPGAPYGMTPGVHHDTGYAPARPYGVLPGQTHYVVPEQVNLDPQPVQPEHVQLDEDGPAPDAPVGPADPPRGPEHTGWQVTDPHGRVVLDMPLNPEASKASQEYQIRKAGQALLDNAVSPGEKASAQRSLDWMLTRVGHAPVDTVTKEGVHRYDVDTGNATKLAIQEMRKRNKGDGKGGVPVGPSKADKFQQQLDDGLRKNIDGIIHEDRSATKYSAISALDNDISEMEGLLSSKNAMGQRVAVQKALLALTGKASRESEQAALTGASGKWEELKNKLALWTSDDPQLSRQYIEEFKGMIAAQRAYVGEQKKKIGSESAQRAYAESYGYPDEQRQMAHDIVFGAMTGQYQGGAAYRSPTAKAPAAPTHGKVDADLLE